MTTVTINEETNTVVITEDATLAYALSRFRYVGSSFSGSNNSTGRSIVTTASIGSHCIVVVGFRVLDPNSEFSINTTTNTNDTLTINLPLANDDVVLLWT